MIEKEIEDKVIEALSAALATMDTPPRVVGTWSQSAAGEVKGEETPADAIVVGVAVGAPQWDTYCVPSCSVPVGLSVAIRRETAPDGVALERVYAPIAAFIFALQCDADAAAALSTESFSVDGARVDGGPPPSFVQASSVWRIARSFNLRGIIADN